MMKKLRYVLSIYLVFALLPFSCFASSDITWVAEKTDLKLYFGDSSTINGYVITAEDFTDESVMISISRNGDLLEAGGLLSGESIECEDKIRIKVTEVDPNYTTVDKDGKTIKTGWNPYTELTVYTAGYPEISISLDTDKDEYNAGDEIKLDITVENAGDSTAEDIIIKIKSILDQEKGKSRYKYDELAKSDEIELSGISFEAPTISEDSKYRITINVTYDDPDGTIRELSTVKTVKIIKAWGLKVTKSFPEYCYSSEKTHFTVTVHNTGEYDINDITLTDTLVSGMTLSSGVIPDKEAISLEAGDQYTVKYTATANHSGKFSVPSAVVEYGFNEESSTIKSESRSIRVYGSDITIDKTASVDGDVVNITISVKNNGNVGANVHIEDELPDNAELVAGEIEAREFLDSGSSATLEYSILSTASILPACHVSYTDLNKCTGTVSSGNVILQSINDDSDNGFNVSSNEEVSDKEVTMIVPTEQADITPAPADTIPDNSNEAGWSSMSIFVFVVTVIATLIVFMC